MTSRNAIMTYLMVFSAAISSAALANTELPDPFDARTAGMGVTGAAFVNSAAAAYHNPAAMEAIGHLDVTLAVTPYFNSFTVPLNGANTSVDSEKAVAPLFFAGAAYRLPVLDNRIVVGLAAYPTAGMSAKYDNVQALGGEDLNAQIFMLETILPVSVRIIDGLSVAAALRDTYVSQTMRTVDPTMGPTEMSLTGNNILGASVGVHYKVNDMFSAGFSYRSKITVETSGDTKVVAADADFTTNSEFAAPHSFRLGAAVSLLDKTLLLAADLKYGMYENSNKTMPVKVKGTPAGDTEQQMPMQWKDVIACHLGAEYIVASRFPVRLGYHISNSATPESTASFFTTPPGLLHSIHGGAGVNLSSWNFDLAAIYLIANGHVDTASTSNMGEGDYKAGGVIVALSGAYHY